MRKIFILFQERDRRVAQEQPCSAKMRKVMERLFTEGKAAGVDFYRANIQWFDLAQKEFAKCWTFENGAWKLVAGIQPDLVFDRCPYGRESRNIKEEIARSFPLLNDPEFDTLASDKYLTYLLFGQWMPRTFFVNSRTDLESKVKNCGGCERFVVKPLNGYGGARITFFDRKEAGNIKIEEPSVLQEFIDGSAGIENIAQGNHDLRILVFGKEIFGAYVRLARSGNLCANIAQGGRRMTLKNADIPAPALSVARRIMEGLEDFEDSFYSIDLIFDKSQTPFLMELNSRPGLVLEEGEGKDFFDACIGRIISHLKDAMVGNIRDER